MGKLIIHDPPLPPEEIAERRRKENLARKPLERFHFAFELMALAARFSKSGIIKSPQGKGIVLKATNK